MAAPVQTPSVTVNGVTSPQPNDSNGIVNYSSGGFTTDASTAAALTIAVGFVPRKVRVLQLTGSLAGTEYELMDQMAATQTLKTILAGTRTIDPNSAIVINNDSGNNSNGRSFTLSATVMQVSSTFVWEAWA
jgi:hypothetical protein